MSNFPQGVFVVSVIDGDTIEVLPNWVWGENQGDRVRLAGVNAPEINTAAGKIDKIRLEEQIEAKNVELRNPQGLSYGRLVCDVYHLGTKVT